MKYASKFLLLSLCLLTLGACSNASLKNLRTVEPEGDAFSQALSRYYLMLSEEEHDYGRYSNSQFMADKGLSSAYAESVFAEIPLDGIKYNGQRALLLKGKKAFDAIKMTGIEQAHPKETAGAQVLYDCWLTRANAKARRKEVEYCQQQFYNHLTLLRHKAHAKVVPPKESSSKTTKASAPVPLIDKVADAPATPAPTLATSYLVYFEWDKFKLNRQALDNLKKMANDILSIKEPFELVLNGHTDRSGGEEYNRTLSQQRADTIRALLVGFGVPKAIMSVFAFGESDPVVKTRDGVKEPKNRRVEIFIE